MALSKVVPRCFRLYVTYLDGDGPFLRISGLLDPQSSLLIENLFKVARKNLENGVGAIPAAAIHDGVVCAAKYKDGTYYRAKVICTTNLDSGLVGVHFIDYGNKSIVSVSNIRFLDNYDPMFLQLQGQATDYYLSRFMHPSGKWEELTLHKLQSLLCYAEYPSTIDAQTQSLPLISVQFKGTDLATYLVTTRFGISLPLQKQGVLLLQQNGDNQQVLNWQPSYATEATYTEHVPFLKNQNFPSYPASAMRLQQNVALPFNSSVPPPSLISQRPLGNKVSSNPVILKALMRQPQQAPACPAMPPASAAIPPATPVAFTKPASPKKSSTYKSRLLEVNSQHKVFVSFAEEGPEHFAVQLVTDTKRLQEMMDDINRRPHSSLAEPPMIGAVCLGRRSEDRIICRAIVMNLSGSQCKLFFVDFGGTEMVSYYDIFDIPNEFVKLNVFPMRFCLSGVKKLGKGLHLNEAFKQLVNGKILSLRVVSPEGPPLIQYGELYLDNMNVLELLQANMKDKLQFKWMEMLTLGSRKYVLVSYVDSCIKFYIQLSDKIDELNAVMDAVRAHCESSSSPGELPVGAACCARCPGNDSWYRAHIRDTKGTKVVVAYVDYGNQQEVEVSDIRTITPELIKLPAQALKCALKGFENKPVETRTSNQFEKLAVEKMLVAHIVGVLSNDTMLVSLVDYAVSPPLDVVRRITLVSQPQCYLVDVQACTPVRKRASGPFSEPELDDGHRKEFDRAKIVKEERRPPRGARDGVGQRGDGLRSGDNELSRQDEWERDNRGERDDRGDRRDNWEEKKEDFQSREFRDNNRERGGDWNDRTESHVTRRDRADRSFGSDGDNNSFPWQDRGGRAGRAPYKPRSQFSQGKELPDPVPLGTPFPEPTVEATAQHDISVTWIISPESFYTQLLSLQPKFQEMMHKIPDLYKGVKSYGGPIPVGASVLARFPADGVLYRATVVSTQPVSKFIVRYIDFGNKQLVDAKDIWQLDQQLLELPKMALHCSLLGVAPKEAEWKESAEIDIFFDAPRYQCVFQEYVEDIWKVSLWNNGVSVGDTLVEKKLAVVSDHQSSDALKAEAIDRTIVVGQQMLCEVTRVESFEKFYIQLDLDKAALVEKAIANFAKLMVLPTELSACHSLPCCLNNYTAESKPLVSLDELETRLTGNKFIIYINSVEEVTLVATLYDIATGHKVALFEPDDACEQVTPLCSRAVFNYNFGTAYIAHSESLDELYLQRAGDSERLAALLVELFHFCEEGTPEPLTTFEVETMCLAKSSDGNWYRATVLSAEETAVKVQYADYGNSETVPKDLVKVLDPKFFEPCALALVASLGLVALTDDALAKLIEWTTDKEVQVTLAFGTDGWLASLHLDGVDLSMKLVNENLATPKVSSNDEDTKEQTAVEELEPVSLLPEGCTQVYISHIDTPGHFWLQMSDKVNKIEEVQAELQTNADAYPDIENREMGTLCVAKYPADEQWYRAEILDSDSDITTVRYIDYGNTEVLDNEPGFIKEMPNYFKEVERYALKSSVNAVPTGTGEWTEPGSEFFTQLVGDLPAPVDALIVLKDFTTYVDIFVAGQNLTDKLVSEGYATRSEENECGDLPPCFASHINSPSEFWIQLETAAPELQTMEAALLDAENFPQLIEKEVGVICAAKYPEDGAWYRAQITVDGSEGTEVLFIDYGNASIANELRTLPDELKGKAALSRKCALQKPRDIKSWSRKSEVKFNELAAEGATIFNVQFIASGDISIVDFYLDGKSVTEELIGLCEENPVAERATSVGQVRRFYLDGKFVKVVNTPESNLELEKVTKAKEEERVTEKHTEDDVSEELNTSQPDLDESVDSVITVIENPSFEAKADSLSDESFQNETITSPEKDTSSETVNNSSESVESTGDNSKDSVNTDTGYTSGDHSTSPLIEESVSPIETTVPLEAGSESPKIEFSSPIKVSESSESPQKTNDSPAGSQSPKIESSSPIKVSETSESPQKKNDSPAGSESPEIESSSPIKVSESSESPQKKNDSPAGSESPEIESSSPIKVSESSESPQKKNDSPAGSESPKIESSSPIKVSESSESPQKTNDSPAGSQSPKIESSSPIKVSETSESPQKKNDSPAGSESPEIESSSPIKVSESSESPQKKNDSPAGSESPEIGSSSPIKVSESSESPQKKNDSPAGSESPEIGSSSPIKVSESSESPQKKNDSPAGSESPEIESSSPIKVSESSESPQKKNDLPAGSESPEIESSSPIKVSESSESPQKKNDSPAGSESPKIESSSPIKVSESSESPQKKNDSPAGSESPKIESSSPIKVSETSESPQKKNDSPAGSESPKIESSSPIKVSESSESPQKKNESPPETTESECHTTSTALAQTESPQIQLEAPTKSLPLNTLSVEPSDEVKNRDTTVSPKKEEIPVK